MCRGPGDRVIDALDASVPDGQGQALQVRYAAGDEGRQLQGALQGELPVADELERQLQPLGQLLLVVGGLRGEAEHLRSDLAEPGMKIAKALRLRRRPVCA